MSRTSDYFGNGAGPLALSQPSGGLVAYPVETYITPSLDLTIVQLGIELIPAKPGHIVAITVTGFLLESVTGTQTTPLQARAGSDPTHTNISPLITTNPTNAQVNSANTPCTAGGLSSNSVPVQILPSLPVFLDIVAGAQGTGGFSLRGRLAARVAWAAIG